MAELTLKPGHELFSGLDLDGATEVEISLGANPACAGHLKGWGVPCVVYPRLPDGSIAGLGRHPGFVVEFEFNDLVEAGATEADLWYALDARKGEYADHDNGGAPVCKECVVTAEPGSRFSDDDPDDWEDDEDSEDGCRGKLYQILPGVARGPCWCCCESIRESMAAAVQVEEEA
jgi:hypothetical protein